MVWKYIKSGSTDVKELRKPMEEFPVGGVRGAPQKDEGTAAAGTTTVLSKSLVRIFFTLTRRTLADTSTKKRRFVLFNNRSQIGDNLRTAGKKAVVTWAF